MPSQPAAFPSNYIEALAIAYVQAHIVEAATPEALARLYWDAYNRIAKADMH